MMSIRRILALTDFSAGAENALDRAALIAARHKAELRLMYVNETCGEWLADRQIWLAQRALQLSRRHGITAIASSRIAVALNDVIEATRRADLVVLDPLGGRSFKGSLRGRAMEQVARHSHCPALVVRLYTYTPYDKAVVAFGSAGEVGELIRCALSFESPAARMAVQMFVASGLSRPAAAKRTRTVPDWSERLQRAWDGCVQVVMQAFARMPGNWGDGRAPLAGRDSMARQMIEQCASLRAKIVIAPRNKPAIVTGFLCKDATQRLVKGLDCDLLLVPAADPPLAPDAARDDVARATANDGRAEPWSP